MNYFIFRSKTVDFSLNIRVLASLKVQDISAKSGGHNDQRAALKWWTFGSYRESCLSRPPVIRAACFVMAFSFNTIQIFVHYLPL